MTSTPTLRPLTDADMPAVAALQLVAFAPLFHEPQEILASRLTVAPNLCWGAFDDDDLLAYILSHPWPAASPPPIGVTLSAPPPSDNWFVHDLAIGPAARGLGLGRALVGAASGAARGEGLTRGDLVAVQGALAVLGEARLYGAGRPAAAAARQGRGLWRGRALHDRRPRRAERLAVG